MRTVIVIAKLRNQNREEFTLLHSMVSADEKEGVHCLGHKFLHKKEHVFDVFIYAYMKPCRKIENIKIQRI